MSVTDWVLQKSGDWHGIPDRIAITDSRNGETIVEFFHANQDLGGRGLGSSRRKAQLLEQRASFVLKACQSYGPMLEALKVAAVILDRKRLNSKEATAASRIKPILNRLDPAGRWMEVNPEAKAEGRA